MMKLLPLPFLFAVLLALPFLANAQAPPAVVNYWETEPAYQKLLAHDLTVLTCSKARHKKSYLETKGTRGLPIFIHPRCGDSNLMAASFSALADPLKRYDSRDSKQIVRPGFSTLNPYVVTKYTARDPVFASFRFVTQTSVVKQQFYIR